MTESEKQLQHDFAQALGHKAVLLVGMSELRNICEARKLYDLIAIIDFTFQYIADTDCADPNEGDRVSA